MRQSGTTVILEDLAFPLEVLGDAILAIQQLFERYQYDHGIIFGHAKDGNIHFVITQKLDSPFEIKRYGDFMNEIVEMVIHKFNGTLKAEHGTGRNMAPFVETEWGKEAYEIMQTLKNLADPYGILNPGVIINDDKQVHLKNFKEMPSVENEVDKCIECGFCESVCPSKNITATPRRRIVARRHLAFLKNKGDYKNYKALLSQFDYNTLDTCAVDGLCANSCPVNINTGELVKKLRHENHSIFENFIANKIALNFKFTQNIVRTVLKLGKSINNTFGSKSMFNLTSFLRKIIPALPVWTKEITEPPKLKFEFNPNAEIIYFPSCISRLLGTYKNQEKNIFETFYSVCAKANINVTTISSCGDTCCGQIFSSKGYNKSFETTANKTISKLWQESQMGKIPVVIDVSSCAYTLHQLFPVLSAENMQKFNDLKILDSIDFIHDWVLSKIEPIKLKNEIVLHSVCAVQKLKIENKFIEIAKKFAHKVSIPINNSCCGMAGDRGFVLPNLTQSATQSEAKEVKKNDFEGYYSSTKTCEMALSAAVAKNYESILYLIDEGL